MSISEHTFEEWYCGFCGTAKKKNTVVNPKTRDRLLTCEDCGIVLRFYVVSPASKTTGEAEKSFKKTQLTKNQEFGSGNKPYKGRKKKK